MPDSAAMRSASGEARSARPFDSLVDTRSLRAGPRPVAGRLSPAGAGAATGGGAGLDAGGAVSSRLEMSSSGAPMTAMSAPIFTVSPGAATIFRMTPFV